MTVAAGHASPTTREAFLQIAAAGVAGGAVDFLYACAVATLQGQSIVRLWQGVAAGWLGPPARAGGLSTAALGLVTHFGIALVMAAAYYLAARREPALLARPLLWGAAYGLVLYVIMYRVVLPLRWPQAFPRWDGALSVADVAAHVGVGLAIALTLSAGARALTARP